jgi:quinol monooxygenase YgiN
MAIKVVVERNTKPGKESEMVPLLRQLRALVLNSPGFVSAEVWQSIEKSNKYLIVSTWKSLPEWQEWQKNKDRIAIVRQIEKLLEEPEKMRLYTEA